jgi:hypothetical protein
MSNKTILILIGGRSAVPTISGVLQLINEINRIKFLVCKGEEYETLQRAALNFIKSKKSNIDFVHERDVRIVDSSSFTQISKALTELLPNGEEISFASLASAPQTMSIASYVFLRDNFPDVTIFTVSTDQAIIIPLKKDEPPMPFKEKLSAEDYILACGHEIYARKSENSFTFQNRDQFKDLLFYFSENIESVDSMLSEIRRQAGKGSNSIKRICTVSLTDYFIEKNNLAKPFLIDFLERLNLASLIINLKISPEISFQINPDSYSFLQGDWLELFTYYQALKCNFDSLESSIEMSNYDGEIDLICLHNSNPLICECKTGKFDKRDILKLRNMAEKLGESYCLKVLIVSAIEIPDEIEQEASNSRVTIFKGQDLKNLSNLLKQEMEDPKYKRR